MYGGMAEPNLHSRCALSEWVFLLALAHRTAEHQRYAAALQQGWPGPHWPEGPMLHPSLIGIRLRASSEPTRASCPGCGYARSFGIHAYRHAVGSRDDEVHTLDEKHLIRELPWMEAGPWGSIIITRARRSYARLRWPGLANRSV